MEEQTMKAKITVEQFDNGISLKWEGFETPDMQAVVALEHDKEKTLGKMIWEDVYTLMNLETCNKIEMEIEYNPVKE